MIKMWANSPKSNNDLEVLVCGIKENVSEQDSTKSVAWSEVHKMFTQRVAWGQLFWARWLISFDNDPVSRAVGVKEIEMK